MDTAGLERDGGQWQAGERLESVLTTKGPHRCFDATPPSAYYTVRLADLCDVLRGRALLTLDQVKLDGIAVGE